jgi:hypothetical protein
MTPISPRRVFLTIAATLCLLGTIATPALAGNATIERTVYLADPAPSGSLAAVVSRDIYLAAGDYTYYVSVRNERGVVVCLDKRDITLASGDYWWYARLSPDINLYDCDSQLWPKSGPAASLRGAHFGAAGGGNFVLASRINSR